MATTVRAPVLTSQTEDFPRWYQDLLEKAELADNGPVRGTMVIRPYGYALWERMQLEMDTRIKAAGAENVYLPLFIPESYLHREAQHVEGFSPELAIVTHAGGKELAEPLVVRPTSETLFGALMSKWVHSYRDLPLLLNQWCNVVRWELRPRLFLRTSEFLWQEGHCAHVSEEDAHAYALQIHLNVYRDFLENVLGIPIVVGAKTSRERFAGAINTMTCEAMMGDGKALQMATSHELGQSFAKVFNITFSDAGGRQQTCWTTSWGCSTRMLGGLIMAHGDGNGLMVPPKLAPTQVVVLLVKEDELASAEADRLTAALTAAGIRVRLDLRTDTSFGRRVTNWELKGIPVRIEIGPRDLAAGNVSVTRRDDKEKWTIATSAVVERVDAILSDIQAAMLEKKRAELQSRTVDTTSIAEAREAARSGFARIPWDALGDDGERELNEDAVSVRCLQTEDGEVPERKMSTGLVALVGRSY